MAVKCNWPYCRSIRLTCILQQPEGKFREVREAIPILAPVEIRAPLRPARALVRAFSRAGMTCRHLGIRLALADLLSALTFRHVANLLQPIGAAMGRGSGSRESTCDPHTGIVNPLGIHCGNPCRCEVSL
jgi:hypothetical protein